MINCVFCQIVQGKEPAYIIYKNKFVTAFLDINPVTDGHVLVSPNIHIDKLNNVKDTDVANALIESLILISNRLIISGMCVDYSIVQDNGDTANQDIKHLHFHIIPRNKDDQVKFNLNTNKKAALEDNLISTFNKLKITY